MRPLAIAAALVGLLCLGGTAAAAGPAPTADEARAAALMRAGSYAEAQLILERIVLTEPTNAGAWLDLAIAHYHLGDAETARALFDFVEREFDPPVPLRTIIAGYRDSLPSLGRGRWSADIALLQGYETNINAASNLSSLSLTLPGGPLVLLLDPRYRPRAAGAALVELRGEGEQPLPGGRSALLAYGEWRGRYPAAQSEFVLGQFQAFAGIRGPLPAAQAGQGSPARTEWVAWIGEQRLSQGGIDLFQAQRLQLLLTTPLQGCRGYAGAEQETRRFPAQPVLDGSYAGPFAGLSCPLRVGWLAANARAGADQPRAARAGGVQHYLEIAATLQYPPWHNGRMEIVASASQLADEQAYSPLLGNTTRRIHRITARIEYAHRLGAGWEALARAELQRQRSNIELFSLDNDAVYAGLRYRF